MAKLHLHNLHKSYSGTAVLHGVEMEIDDGEFVVIVGPSGCGKSSLLRMVAGLESIDAGEVVIGDKVVNRLEPAQRNIAMVFQNYALYPHMTVRQNMSYGLKIAGMPTSLIAKRIESAAEILELDALLDRKPRQLSGGQRQRVAMGRAIVREPAVFLFDEPLSNLDAKLRVQMRLELEALHQRLRTTSLYVTHDQVEAMTLADRMMVLNAGRVEQIGRPAQVYDKPASLFVAGFIGSPAMNLLPLRSTGAGQVAVQGGETGPALALPVPAKFAGQALTLGVRPEHLQPCSPDVAMLNAQVRLVEYLGSDSYAYCNYAGQEVVVRLPAGAAVSSGQALPLTASPSHLHWFDQITGERLTP